MKSLGAAGASPRPTDSFAREKLWSKPMRPDGSSGPTGASARNKNADQYPRKQNMGGKWGLLRPLLPYIGKATIGPLSLFCALSLENTSSVGTFFPLHPFFSDTISGFRFYFFTQYIVNSLLQSPTRYCILGILARRETTQFPPATDTKRGRRRSYEIDQTQRSGSDL